MPIVGTTKMAAQQFLQIGGDPPGVRMELVDGEVAASAGPLPRHSHVLAERVRVAGTGAAPPPKLSDGLEFATPPRR
jgi:hypothetical protein